MELYSVIDDKLFSVRFADIRIYMLTEVSEKDEDVGDGDFTLLVVGLKGVSWSVRDERPAVAIQRTRPESVRETEQGSELEKCTKQIADKLGRHLLDCRGAEPKTSHGARYEVHRCGNNFGAHKEF